MVHSIYIIIICTQLSFWNYFEASKPMVVVVLMNTCFFILWFFWLLLAWRPMYTPKYVHGGQLLQ